VQLLLAKPRWRDDLRAPALDQAHAVERAAA